MKRFSRTIENFVCENCGHKMQGNGYTNHCSNCLWSKHVDINPGDRSSFCMGLMRPVGYDQKKGLLHECVVCKHRKYNKLQPEDNFNLVISLSVNLS